MWSPSNRGTPRETPLRRYAVTQGGGARALSPPRGAGLGHSPGLREVRGGTSVAGAAGVLRRRVSGGEPLPLWGERPGRRICGSSR